MDLNGKKVGIGNMRERFGTAIGDYFKIITIVTLRDIMDQFFVAKHGDCRA